MDRTGECKRAPSSGGQPAHDERPISAALVSLYDELVLAGLLRTGRGESTVIRAQDPLDDIVCEPLPGKVVLATPKPPPAA